MPNFDPVSWGGGTVSSVVGPNAAPATGRGFLVQLGKIPGVNLNSVAANNIFTTPASGFTRANPVLIYANNFSGAPTTNAASFGTSSTPTNFLAAVVFSNSLGAGNAVILYPVVNTVVLPCTAGISFVINVTVGGAAITGDFSVWGFYE